MKLCVLVCALLVLAAAAACVPGACGSAIPPRRLASLSSSDGALPPAARAAHARRFAEALASYGQHLSNAADVVMLQAGSIVAHRDTMRAAHAARAAAQAAAAADSDAGADMDGETEGQVEGEVEAEAAHNALAESGLQFALESAFASGDSMGVVTVLQQAHGLRLQRPQQMELARRVEEHMKAVQEHMQITREPIDRNELVQQLDALIQNPRDLFPEPEPHALLHTASSSSPAPAAPAPTPKSYIRPMPQPSDEPLGASNSLDITRSITTPPEAVRDVEATIRSGADPWYDLPGRSTKMLRAKSLMVSDLLDAHGERCPGACSMHGQCVMDLNHTMQSSSGATNVHPFQCVCDVGYVGDACQIKLDMYLRWLLTEGAAPFPKCCSVCARQRKVPEQYDDIPAFNNPFAAFAPQCQPYPRISMYSREDGTHELIKGRRPDPSCSAPLGEITRADPIVALELAADLGSAQKVLESSLMQDMAFLSESAEHVAALSEDAVHQHVTRLHAAGDVLSRAASTAEKAAAALAAKLHISDLTTVKASSIDLAQLIEDYRELPNEMEECCLYCQQDSDPATLFSESGVSTNPGANAGPNAILHQDPRADTALDAIHRRMAQRRRARRHARLMGVDPDVEEDPDCCVVCPYNLREIERLREAAHLRAQQAQQVETDNVFLEVFAEVDRDRRRRNEPYQCCAACPSQFLIAHAFPAGPFSTARTRASQGL